MKISLSSLCLILTLTFSALACNQSDPFNQKRSDVQKEIKTDIGEDDTIKNLRRANVVGALLGLHAGAYLFCKNDQNLALMCVSGAILNRVSELRAYPKTSIGSENPEKIKTGLGENANNKYKTALIVANIVAGAAGVAGAVGLLGDRLRSWWPLPIVGAAINGVSTFDLDAKHSKINVRIGVTNLVWGAAHVDFIISALVALDPMSTYLWLFPYWGIKGTLNIVNAVYRLYWVRKQKN